MGEEGDGCPASGSWSWSEDDGGGVVDGGGIGRLRGRLESGDGRLAGGEVEGGREAPVFGTGWYEDGWEEEENPGVPSSCLVGGGEGTEKLRGERGRGEERLWREGEAEGQGDEHGGAAGADGESDKKQKIEKMLNPWRGGLGLLLWGGAFPHHHYTNECNK